jgi:hypothetical protein
MEPSMPFDFQQLANFRLARGSHKQPNKGGNICVNEAAVIAAGFQYREIRDVSCLPDCFSRPVSEYAIYLNDFMMHRARNELLVPFITRLPGTSHAPWVEEKRARLIVVETVRRIVAAEYDEIWRKPTLAARCRAVQLFEQVSPAICESASRAAPGMRETGAQRAPRVVCIPISASVPAAPPRLRRRRVPSGRGSVRVPIEKSGRWPPSSSRKPFCLGEMTGSTIPWRQLSGWNEGRDSTRLRHSAGHRHMPICCRSAPVKAL